MKIQAALQSHVTLVCKKPNEIRKVANFASYKEANGLVPYEFYNIFRAVGPWGKVFKRSTVIDNNMKFKNLKYGEDKLFYSELISKSQSASMSPEPVYHVNRYADNISLIKATDMMEKLLINDKYKNVYHTYHHNQKNFVSYIEYMIYEANAYKYIKDHMVYFKYPESFKNLVELKTKCTAIYNGTRLINNTFYEVIELYKQPNIAIDAVKLVKIKDDRFSKKVDFIVENDCIYIKTDDLKFEDTDFNISIQYNGFDQVLVRATYPNFNDQSKLKRQNFHLEFISDKKKLFH